MRVLVVTEIRLYRDGVADLLRALPDVAHVATAATTAGAVAAARRQECDLALLDVTMERALVTVAALRTARRDLRVVAMGVHEDGLEVVACAEAGVSGYVSRDAGFDEVAGALRSAARGEVACSGRVAAELIRHIGLQARATPTVSSVVPLTRREREVLRLVQSDMSNKEIARALDLQLSTVKNHVHNVLAKCGVTGRGEVAGALARIDAETLSRGRAQYLEGSATLT
ncbi:LuxR C-terminal-related transcriptional regulator [Blastococcus saxobsidens]|uniref:Putative Nitrate/nitrite response regulator protein narL n=1 Tax=Blastococcus saxobsidens (strain DD2) TaxID=1146883 RepID=H6RQ77_BLASD|nr:response regulator transcription factor [Blastococcus saxobsidens]CCG04044.1 putative Nitrate/nitrite response regulator protein narL [Blastococcus saxobsidens DD2]